MFSVSTNWIPQGELSGEEIVDAIIDIGADALEVGYFMSPSQLDGLRRCHGKIPVSSVHAYASAMGAIPHPEAYILSSRDESARRRAVQELGRVGAFAAEMGASVVVVHGGHLTELTPQIRTLRELAQGGRRHDPTFAKAMDDFMRRREALAPKYVEALRRSLAEVIPVFESLNVTVAIENMPTHHGMPGEHEMQQLLEEFPSPRFGYWHDFGHGAVKEQYGWIHHEGVLRRALPRLAGMHIHTNEPGAFEDQHLMPPRGLFAYGRMSLAIPDTLPRVLEPWPGTPADEVRAGLAFLRQHW